MARVTRYPPIGPSARALTEFERCDTLAQGHHVPEKFLNAGVQHNGVYYDPQHNPGYSWAAPWAGTPSVSAPNSNAIARAH